MKKLFIVEAPGKIKKLSAILGNEWEVIASYGHIADLTKKNGDLGFDKNTLKLDYELSTTGKRQLDKMKAALKNANEVYIASDLDREGEAIAEEIRYYLDLGENYKRCTFDSITKPALLSAIDNPRKIDKNMVDAQESRRMIDRVVGWETTAALSNYLGTMSPVGRVQSPVVRAIVDRQREIDKFVSTDHYGIRLGFEGDWTADLDIKESKLGTEVDGKLLWLDKDACEKLKNNIQSVIVTKSEVKESLSYAPPAFKTTTMQQAASRKLKISAKKCDELAQALYEDGRITYLRTDSTTMSQDGYNDLARYAKSKGYRMANEMRNGKSAPNAQEAHECIRPTHFDDDGSDLPSDQKALYQLIFNRALASQLTATVSDVTTLELTTTVEGKPYIFKASGSMIKDKGWREIFADDDADDDDENKANNNKVPNLAVNTQLTIASSMLQSKKTQPPTPFDDVSIVAYMEAKGIGRPSTTATTIEKIGDSGHKYVTTVKVKNKNIFKPTERGYKLVDSLVNTLSIMEANFTSNIEKELDDIAKGKMKKDQLVKEFFKTLDKENDVLRQREPLFKPAKCEECGYNMMRLPTKDKKGHFWGCTNQECRHVQSDENGEAVTKEMKAQRQKEKLAPFLNPDGTPKFPCPKCSKPLIRIESKKTAGFFFWACSSPKSDNCGYMDGDDAQNTRPRAELAKEFTNADGSAKFPCKICKKPMIKLIAKSGNPYWHCVDSKCEGMAFHDKDNDRPSENEKRSDPDWLVEIKKNSLTADGKAKWPCPKCKAPIYLKTRKDGTNYGQCSNKDCMGFYDYVDGKMTKQKNTSSGKGPKPKDA